MLKTLRQPFPDRLHDALRTSDELFKIIIPISIVTRFLQRWGVVDQIGLLLKVLPQSFFERYPVRRTTVDKGRASGVDRC
ncbi:MAG: hypothetical protein KAT62_02405 [Desulfuromonadales bacterium]|nr:hypothetical protein [Chloroflexota bacterium]MCK4621048.1 hypothetical protein [Desulfuromonadales bacterium]